MATDRGHKLTSKHHHGPHGGEQDALLASNGNLEPGQEQELDVDVYKKTQRSTARFIGGFPSLVIYMTWAVGMNFINKYAMTVYPLQNVLLVLQMLATIACLLPLVLLRVLDFPVFSPRRCLQLLGVTLLYASNSALALCGLKSLNIPMYHTLKRVTPILTLFLKAAFTRRLPSSSITGSVALVVLGCVVAGLGDLHFDLAGYAYALSSAMLQAMYLVLIELQGAKGISTEELLYYNALNSLPFLMGVVLFFGEHRTALPAFAAASQAHGFGSALFAVLSCSTGGLLLNFTMFLCTVSNGAVTLTVFGALRGVAIVVLGFFFLHGGVKFSVLNVTGIMINLVGGTWYSWLEYRKKTMAVTKNAHQHGV